MIYSPELKQNHVNYERILSNLKMQSENAYQDFVLSGNLVIYATVLSEIVLNALDEGLCYPQFDIYQFLKECRQVGQTENGKQ